jgi:hypothetical protein
VLLEEPGIEEVIYHYNEQGIACYSSCDRTVDMQSIVVAPLAEKPFEPLQMHKALAACLLLVILIDQLIDQILS